jgi:hypothetical protein
MLKPGVRAVQTALAVGFNVTEAQPGEAEK